MGHKGYYGQYSGNSKFSKDHAHTRVTSGNYKATERDDAAHIDYLKRDIDYDNKHGHSDEKMTADEKHISKLAGDMKYDKEHHGSPAKRAQDGMSHEEMGKSPKALKMHIDKHPHHTGLSMNSPAKHKPMSGKAHIHNKGSVSYKGDATFEKAKKKGGKVIPAGKPYESRDAYLKDSTRNEKHNAAPEMHRTGKRKK
ncbi:MAG: hypothetical protein CBC27_08450 [Opitutia bacterium TMED67]|mgnify:CR=1 FL=1|nr:MAG: hypothetical protein CBC27_08450 [Opitutae bacterium TMED67]|tara:strand:+ start:351 stop:941 length:591 start_codon:yes stop_codon:yes gene_type:complete